MYTRVCVCCVYAYAYVCECAQGTSCVLTIAAHIPTHYLLTHLQTSMDGGNDDESMSLSRKSSRPGSSHEEGPDTQEGQYGSRPSSMGGVGTMADAPTARTEEDIAAEEERLRQEEEMARQVQEMREELARVYERDLVTFFDLYLALSQPV